MIKKYRFKNIENYLKKDSTVAHEILDIFQSLFDAAIIFAPVFYGSQLIPLLDLLEVNDRIFNIGHKLCDYIATKVELHYLDRLEQIEASYALICYTAYFDALEKELPKKVIKNLKDYYQKAIDTEDQLESGTRPKPENGSNLFFADHITSFAQIEQSLSDLYSKASKNLINILSEVFGEHSKEFRETKAAIESLPEKAVKYYREQYFRLSNEFSDFALFAQLENFSGLENTLEKNQAAINLLNKKADGIDMGLKDLRSIVDSLPYHFQQVQAQEIIEDLSSKYRASIKDAIINDKEIQPERESISVTFPLIEEAFIPQDYKCMLYNRSNDINLEDEAEWDKIKRKTDLNKFFIQYLYSPISLDFPLIILGHPGSGKSLLTKVLAAQLISQSYTVIRIPLREVNAELGFDVLVEEQIKKITNRTLSMQGYGGFAQQFKDNPITIVLDGYDELLQAKGDAFSGFIERARAFQQDQKIMKRPVRMIITSRITLIDKAYIPDNSTILRLMEFDENQISEWIKIWNESNDNYFKQSNIKPFSLPNPTDKNNILELASQPLLLLMLALYDSYSNELAQTSNIKRTDLYDSLLRRFVRRERSRYVKDFSVLDPVEQNRIVEEGMNRLGIAAIGMFNRRDVVIKSKQLKNDLDLFNDNRKSTEKYNPYESDSLLGSFFFVYQSKAKDSEAHSHRIESAYEFLHNTFGEFLAADFILRNTINEINNIIIDRTFKRITNYHEAYYNGWYYCLMFVPLYSRPVVVEMLREHFPNALERALSISEIPLSITQELFLENLDFLVKSQLNMILNSRNVPKVMMNGIISDRDIPLIGYLSIYSLNLIILSCTLRDDGFLFDESDYTNHESREKDSSPWRKLSSLWKAWFSDDELTGLYVILHAERIDKTRIVIESNKRFEATHYNHPVDILLCVSSTLADNLLTGLSGIQTERFPEIAKQNESELLNMLQVEDIDLYFSYLIKQIRREINGVLKPNLEFAHINYNRVNRLIEKIIKDRKLENVQTTTFLDFFELLENCLQRNIIFIPLRKKLINRISHIINLFEHRINNPEIACGIRVLRLLTDTDSIVSLDRRYEDYYSIQWADDVTPDYRTNRMIRSVLSQSIYPSDTALYELELTHQSYQNSLIDIIEKSLYITSSQKTELLKMFLEPKSIDLYLKTNPELITHAMLIFIKSSDNLSLHNPSFFEEFIKKCLNCLSNYGIKMFGYEALINTIKISNALNITAIDNMIKDFLEEELFRKKQESFMSILYHRPKIAYAFLQIIPDFFRNNPHTLYGSIYSWNKIPLGNHDKLFDYISCFRSIETILGKLTPNDFSEFKKYIKNSMSESDLPIDFGELTYKQIDDLIWFTYKTFSKGQAERIINKLNKYKGAINDPDTSEHVEMSLKQLLFE